ncbi:MAG: right-handed parallel beta-helix repeat-containing protein [Halobacteriales archaeon]|nr:right-handed parallel beta-helix repeat-containing protein [Halobacteriales archaeon]
MVIGLVATGSAMGQQTVSECQVLNTPSGTYELNQSITNSTTDTCLEITADGVTLDGDGRTVDGVNQTVGSTGILVDNADSVTVKNFGNVTRWETGVEYNRSSGSELTDNVVENNSENGIKLDESGGNTLESNTATENQGNGIMLVGSDDSTLESNTATENQDNGIMLVGSDDNTLESNTAKNSQEEHGIMLVGNFRGNTLDSNTATENQGNGIMLVGRYDGNTLEGNTATENQGNGIMFAGNSNGNTLTGNTATENQENGMRISSDDNTLTDNTARNNDNFDFRTDDSSNNVVENLDIGASTAPGTTLSFEGENVQLRSNTTPPADPADTENIGRYFEAEPVPGTTGSFLDVSLSYENGDVGSNVGEVKESTLRLLRFNTTAGGWQTVPNSTRDTANNLVSANITTFSNFGAFGEPVEGCIDRRSLGRAQEDEECPFDRDVQRGETREELDRSTGRGGTGEHRDSDTARRNRGR